MLPIKVSYFWKLGDAPSVELWRTFFLDRSSGRHMLRSLSLRPPALSPTASGIEWSAYEGGIQGMELKSRQRNCGVEQLSLRRS
jgi:hypothetical protein